jgi:hypothetical protein
LSGASGLREQTSEGSPHRRSGKPRNVGIASNVNPSSHRFQPTRQLTLTGINGFQDDVTI